MAGALLEWRCMGPDAKPVGDALYSAFIVDGCIGLVTLLAAKAYGATQIIVGDVLEKRLNKARELGTVAINTAEEDFAAKVMELTGGRGADVCIDCAGFSATVDSCLSSAKPAGTVIIVGLGQDRVDGFNTGIMSTKELTVKSIFRYRNLFPTAINAIAGGRIDVGTIVSHRFSFDDTINAFATCHKDIRNVVKGVIEY